MAASSWCCKLFDRNGSQIREYGKGDPYIRDLKHTTGHVAGISTAIWVPNDPDRFLTASEDGTMRIWHIGYRQKSEVVIPVKSSVSGTGGRSAISAAVFSNDFLLTGSVDGSIKLWDSSALMSAGSVPMGTVSDAHLKGEKITCFAVSHANPDSFASRSTDDTVKLWDRRNFKCPVQTFCDLPTIHSETSLVFAAKDARLLTGTATGIAVLDPLNSTTRTIIPSASAIVSLAWNERTEQLLAGSTAGTIQVHFDPEMGNGKGVLLMRKSASAARIDGEVDISADSLYNNSCGGIGQFDSVASASRAPSKRKLDKIRSDPIKSHRPEMPSFGPGQGGRIGSNVTQTIMKSVLKDTTRDVDPRAALLSYAERAAKNPKFVATAYQETQPDPLLDPSLLDKEVAIEEEKQRKLDEMERLKADKEKINARFK
jgi:WD repeat-containing protein 70